MTRAADTLRRGRRGRIEPGAAVGWSSLFPPHRLQRAILPFVYAPWDTHQVVIRGRSQCFAMIAPCQTLKRPHAVMRTGGPRGSTQGGELKFPCQPVAT